VSGQCQAPAALPLGKVPHWIGDWVGPRVSLDEVEKRKFMTLSGLELRPLSRPARSQSLYRLRYLDSMFRYILEKKMWGFKAGGNGLSSWLKAG
jgi:hypothetical protein